MDYELELTIELTLVHLVFYVSFLRKCIIYPSLVVPLKSIGVKNNMSYEEASTKILDRQVRKLRNKEISSVNVLSRNQLVERDT